MKCLLRCLLVGLLLTVAGCTCSRQAGVQDSPKQDKADDLEPINPNDLPDDDDDIPPPESPANPSDTGADKATSPQQTD